MRSGPSNKPLTNQALATSQVIRCTRCWKTGHTWDSCRVKICSVCKTNIVGFKICPNINKHTDSDTKFIPKSLRGKKPSEWVLDTPAGPLPITPDQVKNAEKHSQALRSALKKRGRESNSEIQDE